MRNRLTLIHLMLLLAAGGCGGREETKAARSVPIQSSNEKAESNRAIGDATPEKRIATH